jgi:hypothetical protein
VFFIKTMDLTDRFFSLLRDPAGAESPHGDYGLRPPVRAVALLVTEPPRADETPVNLATFTQRTILRNSPSKRSPGMCP